MVSKQPEFGEKLKRLRNEKRYTLRQAALQAELSSSFWSQIENGKRNVPKPETLRKMAKGLRIPANDVLNLAGLGVSNIGDQPTPDLIVADQSIRVYGQIHAGAPSFAEQNVIGSIPVTQNFINDYGSQNLFALQIKGDSMSRVIPDSYIGVFAKGIHIETNDIVAVLIDGDDATIKRYHETSKVVMFEPDSYNPTYQPIIFQKTGEQDFEILGKFLYATSMPI